MALFVLSSTRLVAKGKIGSTLLADGSRVLLSILRTVIDGEDDQLIVLFVGLVDDDVGESRDTPLVGSWNSAGMPELGKVGEPIRFGEDSVQNTRCRSGTSKGDVRVNLLDVGERFKREAHLHTL